MCRLKYAQCCSFVGVHGLLALAVGPVCMFTCCGVFSVWSCKLVNDIARHHGRTASSREWAAFIVALAFLIYARMKITHNNRSTRKQRMLTGVEMLFQLGSHVGGSRVYIHLCILFLHRSLLVPKWPPCMRRWLIL